MAATIRDVARQAGVGLGTVSRVLNNSPLVSPATRQRVLDVIAQLQYTPSQIARSFALGKTLTAAVIAPFFTRPAVVERLRGVEAALAASNYNLVVFNVETASRRNECLRELPRRDHADGFLIISLEPWPHELSTLQSLDLPVVLLDAGECGLPAILSDDSASSEMAVRFLIGLGHQRVAFLSDSLDDIRTLNMTSSRKRLHGYRQALAANGLALRPEYQSHGPYGRAEARLQAQRLLSIADPPTAIVAASDTQALGVLEAARDLQIAVPDQLSVIGFDDIDAAEYLGLSTIRQPLFTSGQLAGELLLARMNGAAEPASATYLPSELVVRRTTAQAPW